MNDKPSYIELKQRIKALEKDLSEAKRINNILRRGEHFQQTRPIEKDTTERRYSWSDFGKSEETYRLLTENSRDMIYRMSLPDGNYEYVSPASVEMLGYPPEDFYDSPLLIREIIHPDWVEYFHEQWGYLIKGEMPPSYEYQIIHRSGDERWMHQRNVLILDDNGNPIAIEGAITDITDRKLAEQALKEGERKYRMLFEHAGFGINIIDPETVEPIEFNRKAHEQLEYSSDEYRNIKPFGIDAIKPEDEIMAHNREIIKNGGDTFETKLKTKRGGFRDVLISAVPVIIDGRDYIHNIIADITDQKRLEYELLQSQKMESIGTMAGGIAHDFNNILSPILMHSEMGMMKLPFDSPVQHDFKAINEAGLRARNLVMQILTFSRKGKGEQVKVKVTPILEEVLNMLRSFIPANIEIVQNMQASSDTVLADPTQIHQVIMNLGSNATHALRERGGILEVSLVQEDLDSETAAMFSDLNPGPYLKLTVRDDGIGMDNKVIQKIFEPYFSTRMPGEGTGMGLALVHGIVKSHGGDITVESELGTGTTFNLYLPRVEDTLVSSGKFPDQLPKGFERVLCVDDEKPLIDAMELMLKGLGYEVTAMTSSIETLDLFKNDPNGFDLVITDMTMPIMSGYELVKEILLIRPDIPIILCTGFSKQINKEKAEDMGISAYMMKPVGMHDMANTVRSLLDES